MSSADLRRVTERHRTVSFIFVVAVGLCLYLPLLTRNYDPNGMMEASAVRSGDPAGLWNPNHMLYRPVGYFILRTLEAAGLQPGVIPLLQILSAVFGALGLGFSYLAFERLSANRTIAIWMSVALGVSWSYWTLSTDVYYYSMAAMLAAASLAAFLQWNSTSGLILCGLLAGLSILTCQANVVLMPGLAIAALLRRPSDQFRRAIRDVMWICIPAGVIVGLAFVGVGVLVYHRNSISALMDWGTNYSGNRLPIWGTWWPPIRFVHALGSAFRSVVGMDFRLFPFFLRHLQNGVVPSWIPPLGFVILTGLLAAAYRISSGWTRSRNRTLLWLLVLYSTYIPFVWWWEAIEPRWFIVPNIFLAALTAVLLSHWSNATYFRIALPVGVLMLAVMNLVTSAWPKHFKESNDLKMAACVSEHLHREDLFLATEWNWSDYLSQFHNRDVLSFIGEVSAASRDKNLAMMKIRTIARERQQKGGHVFMIDIASYPAYYMQWLEDQTGLTAEDLRTYKGRQAFHCLGSDFLQLD